MQNPSKFPYKCCTHYSKQGYDEGYLMLPIFRDLEYKKEKDRLDLAQQLAKKQQDATQRYIEIMRPYVDKPILSIPKDIMGKATAALEEAKAADRQWRKLVRAKA